MTAELRPWQPLSLDETADLLGGLDRPWWIAGGWAIEILLEDHHDDRWLYRRNHALTLPLDRLGRTSADGKPYICPEVALLFKSGQPFHDLERNAADFEAGAPALHPSARAWLRDALGLVSPHHPWLARL